MNNTGCASTDLRDTTQHTLVGKTTVVKKKHLHALTAWLTHPSSLLFLSGQGPTPVAPVSASGSEHHSHGWQALSVHIPGAVG